MTQSRHQPLNGVNVLDLTRVLAGPLCTMMLADLGARVIKVEQPGTGDESRGWGPPFDDRGLSSYFLSINRNKLSLAADFRRAEDVQIVRALIKKADVVVDNFLPGALAQFGLDADAMVRENERLVWCTIGGFASDPGRPGYDFVVQAESGWMSITGERDGSPMKVGVALADVVTGKDAALTILAALVGRSTGHLSPEQRRLRVYLAESASSALINVAQNVLVSGKDAGRYGNGHPNLVPYQLFEAEDRPFVIAVGNDRQWRAMALSLELHELARDERLKTNPGRVTEREHVVRVIAEKVRTKPAEFWIERLRASGVPCGLVRSVGEALGDVECSGEWGIEPAWGGVVRYRPPLLNEHGDDIRAHHWSVFDNVPILAN